MREGLATAGPEDERATGGASLVDWEQAGTLTERYVAVLLGDLGNTLLLLIQVPIIGGLMALSWGEAQADEKLAFCLCLSAIWLGCVNACREIVKEREIYRRERMVNLQISAYVISKFQVLAVLDAVQCALLVWMVDYYVGLPGNELMLFLVLYLGALGATGLGLAISALVSSSDKAVGLVPIVLLPQIIFTRLIMPPGAGKGIVGRIQDLNPLRWVFDLYGRIEHWAADPDYGAALQDAGILMAFALAFLALSMMLLWWYDEA